MALDGIDKYLKYNNVYESDEGLTGYYGNKPIYVEPSEEDKKADEAYNLLMSGVDLERAKELEDNRKYRHISNEQLQRNFDGTLETDTTPEVYAKYAVNKGIDVVDWLLEASEHIGDFGQGDWLDNAHIDYVYKGKNYSMKNKDIHTLINKDPNELQKIADYIKNTPENPNADKVFYTLKKFDGLDENGKPKYLYKYGVAKDSVYDRYIKQYVEDGYKLVMSKRIPLAEEMENKLHSTIQALNNRALDKDRVKTKYGYKSTDEASKVNFGSGYTELYNTDILGVDNPNINYEDVRKKDEEMSRQRKLAPKYDGQFGESIDALQAGTLGVGANLLDFVGNKLILDPLGFHSNTLEEMANQDNIDRYVGYNRQRATAGFTEALADFKQGNYSKSILDIVKNGGLPALAETLPNIGLFFLDAPLQGAATASKISKASKVYDDVAALTKTGKKLRKAIDVATKQGKLSRAEKLQKQYDDLKVLTATTLADKGINLGKNADVALDMFLSAGIRGGGIASKLRKAQIGLLLNNTVNTNRVLNDRKEEKKKQGLDPNLSAEEIASTWLFELPFTALDKVTDLSILKGKTGDMIKEAVQKMPEPIKKNFVTKLATTAGALAAEMGKEAAQEYVQTWGEILGSQALVGSNTVKGIFQKQENQDEALTSALVGGVVGGMMHTGQHIYNNKLIKPLIESYQSNKIAEQIRQENNVDKIFEHVKDNDDIYTAVKDSLVEYTNAIRNNQEISDSTFVKNVIHDPKTFEETVNKAYERYVEKYPNSKKKPREIRNLIANNIITSAKNAHNEIIDKYSVADSIIPYATLIETAKKAGYDVRDSLSQSIKGNINKISEDFSKKVDELSEKIETSPETYIENYNNLSEPERVKLKNEALNNAIRILANEYKNKISNIKSSLLKIKGSGFNVEDVEPEVDNTITKFDSIIKSPKTIEQVNDIISNFGFKLNTKNGEKEYFSVNKYKDIVDSIDSSSAFSNFVLNRNLENLNRFVDSRHRKIFSVENPDSDVFKKFKHNLIRGKMIENMYKENEELSDAISKLHEKAKLFTPEDNELINRISSMSKTLRNTQDELIRKRELLNKFNQAHPNLSNHSFVDAKGNIIVDIDEMRNQEDKLYAQKLFDDGMIGKLIFDGEKKSIIFNNGDKPKSNNEKKTEQIKIVNNILNTVTKLINFVADNNIDEKKKEELIMKLIEVENEVKEILSKIENNVFYRLDRDQIINIKNKLVSIRKEIENSIKKEPKVIRLNTNEMNYLKRIGSRLKLAINFEDDEVRNRTKTLLKQVVDLYNKLNNEPTVIATSDELNFINNEYQKIREIASKALNEKQDKENNKNEEPIKIKYQDKEYTIVGSKILNSKGKEVYKKENDGNRKRILLKADLLNKRAELVTLDNGKKYAIYPDGSVYSLQTANEIKHKGIIKAVREKSSIYKEPTEQQDTNRDVRIDKLNDEDNKILNYLLNNNYITVKSKQTSGETVKDKISKIEKDNNLMSNDELRKKEIQKIFKKDNTLNDYDYFNNYTENEINRIKSRKISDKLLNKIKDDIELFKNHPDFEEEYKDVIKAKKEPIEQTNNKQVINNQTKVNNHKEPIKQSKDIDNNKQINQDEYVNNLNRERGAISEKRLKIQRMLKDIENAFAELEPSEGDKKLIDKAKELRDKIFDDSLVGSIDNSIEAFNNIYNKLAKNRTKYNKGLTTVLNVNPENFKLNKKEDVKDEKDNNINQENNGKDINNDTIDELEIEKLNNLNIEAEKSVKKKNYQTVGSIEKIYDNIKEPIGEDSKMAISDDIVKYAIRAYKKLESEEVGNFLDKISKELEC